MTDYFEVLGVRRRPWLEEEPLRIRFVEQSALVHPDRVHEATVARRKEAQEHYTSLNAAYQTLRDPKSRLLHLLTLERGQPPSEITSIPHQTTDLFLEVGNLCQETDRFLEQGKGVTSPLLKVRLFEEGQRWIDRIQVLQRRLDEWREALYGELKALSELWDGSQADDPNPERSPLPLNRLEQIYRLLSYAGRWTHQLQERVVALTV